jgi:hypothetical protein
MRTRLAGALAATLLAGLACTTNRAVDLSAGPQSMPHYLESHHPADVQVTDAAGARFWLHGPRVSGDSLLGTLSREEPRERRAIALTSVRSLAIPHFSAGKTFGLIGAVIGTAGLMVIILADGSQPVY